MFKKPSNPVENRLLATLPPNEYVRLLPKLEPAHFPKNRILYETGNTMRYAYFLNTGMVSVLAVGEDGRDSNSCGRKRRVRRRFYRSHGRQNS